MAKDKPRNDSSGSGYHPGQLKTKRKKRHISPPLNDRSATGKNGFSVGISVAPPSGGNINSLNHISEIGSEPENVDENSKLRREDNTDTSKVFQSEKEMVHRDLKRVRMYKRRRKAKSRLSIREDDLAVHVRTIQGSESENGDENRKLRQEDNIDTSKVSQSEKEMVHRDLERVRMYKRRQKAKSRMSIREDDLAVHVRTIQAVEIVEAPHENVDSALDNQKNTEMRRGRRSGKTGKDYRCHIQHVKHSLCQPQTDVGSNYSSVLSKRRNGSENTDCILPSASTLMPSTEKENSLNSTVFDDSNNYCIPSVVNLGTPTCSNIRLSGNLKQKKKSLNVEGHHNHGTGSSCFHDSIIREDEDDTDVLALKNINLLDKERNACPVLPERALRSTFRKKLLILDLNGILCDVVFCCRDSRMPSKKVGTKSVFKRPFLDDFMSFCFEKFAVGIWSSRNKVNVAGVIDYIMGDTKDKLLFSWDQSKCTLTGFNTINERYKPLVLKELIKLWDKEDAALPWEKGDYSPSNTLLVDDSPYKALCNPPNTAIFPFPYNFRDEGDNFLVPGGAFRAYLEGIAMADDVQEHVKKHSFGQLAITSADEKWSFYKNIIDRHNSMALT